MSRDLREFGKYVIPSIIAMVIGGSFSIVDTIFIGQAGGKNALAAVSLTWPLLMLLMSFGSLAGAGGAVLIAQSHGAGDEQKEKRLFAQTTFMILVLSVIRVAAFYYQATGNIAKSSWLIYGDSFLALPLCIYVLPVFFGTNGVWMAMPLSRILLMLLLLYFWFGIKRKDIQ